MSKNVTYLHLDFAFKILQYFNKIITSLFHSEFKIEYNKTK